jgi:hypothetical protein
MSSGQLGGYQRAFLSSMEFIILTRRIRGHLQTLYCVVGDFSHVDAVEYER